MATALPLRRSRRLQEKRDRIEINQINIINEYTNKRQKISGKKRKRSPSKSRTRETTQDEYTKYESSKKKQKIKHNYNQDGNVMKTIYFKNHLDQRQYTKIFEAIINSKIYENLEFVPSVITKEISEFATGSFKKCYNEKFCGNDNIHILNQHNSSIDEALLYEDEVPESQVLDFIKLQATFIINETESEYFRYLSRYFCDKCCEDISCCSVCNTLCINNGQICGCGHSLVYCNKCSIECDHCSMPICNKNDETKNMFTDVHIDIKEYCHEYYKCMNCNKKSCNKMMKVNKRNELECINCCSPKQEKVITRSTR